MEEYTKEGLEKVLTPVEIRALFEIMSQSGWGVLHKLNKAIKEDWIEQTANIDYSTKDDDEMMRVMRHKQGMIKGVTLFLNYLEKKHKEAIKKAEKQTL